MGAPVRVLHVAKSLGLGGTEKAMQLLACSLDRSRFSPMVLSPKDGPRREQLQAAGVEVHVCADLLGAMRRIRPEVVHVHRAGWPEPQLMRQIELARAPVVVETNVFGRFDPSAQGKLADRILFVSEFCLARYCRMHGLRPESLRLGVLPNPVETAAFEAVAPDFSRPVIGRVSRADPGKWSRLLLDALPYLARLVPSFACRIIGGTDEARRTAEELGVNGRIQWVDEVESDAELARFHQGCALHCHANDTGETFGMVIAEAMAAGLPVITHPVPGLGDNAQLDLVEHGRTGLVANTPRDYAFAAAWLLQNPDKARAMGAAGRAKVRRRFETARLAAKLEAVYLELLAAKAPAVYARIHGATESAGTLHAHAAGL